MMTIKRWQLAGYFTLASRFQLITIETLGHGKSERPQDPAAYERRDVAADVIAVMDAVGVESAHVWGYSRGGAIAANVATLYPDRARSLITGGFLPVPISDGPPPDRLVTSVRRRIDALKAGDWEAYWVAFGLPRDPRLEADLQTSSDPEALAAILEANAAPPDFRNDFSPFRDRMLVYAGGNDLGLHDATARETFARNCEAIGARLELLDGLDHAQAFQRSDFVLPFVRQFLASLK